MFPPPKLSRCIAWYNIAHYLLGGLGSISAPFYGSAIEGFFLGGLWILFLTHAFFIFAPMIYTTWWVFTVLLGVPLAIALAATQLRGWPRNVAVLALLFAANFYSIAVAGRNG